MDENLLKGIIGLGGVPVILGLIQIIKPFVVDTRLYPVISMSYVWVALFSKVFLHEEMNKYKWLGIILIVGGVILIGFGS